MRIGFMLFDGVEELDIVGPWEVFALLERMGTPLQRFTLGPQAGWVRASGGLRLGVDYAWDEAPSPDWLIVPGGPAVRPEPPKPLVDWVERTAPGISVIASVCTGSFVLAEAGLLDGRRATTNHGWLDVFRQRYPRVDVVADDVVPGERIWTAGAIASGIPLALALVRQHWGVEQAEAVARRLNYRIPLPGGS